MRHRGALVHFPGTAADTARRIDELMRGAVASHDAGNVPSEIDQLRAILRLDPGHVSALINLGTAMYARRSYRAAAALYERATLADPRRALAFFNYGNALEELGRRAEAVVALQAAVMLEPEYADAHYNLALVYQAAGRCRKALPHWSRYVRLAPSDRWADHARRQIRDIIAKDVLRVAYRNPSISGLNMKHQVRRAGPVSRTYCSVSGSCTLRGINTKLLSP